MKQIIINSEELQTRVAVVNNGILHDFFMERNARDRMVGSIYKARIKNLEPSLQAAFVDIGFGKNAFLHYWDMIPATQEMFEEDLAIDADDEEDIVEDEDAQPITPATPNARPVQIPRPQEQRQNSNPKRGQGEGQRKQPTQPPPKGNGFFARLCRLFWPSDDEDEPVQPPQKQRPVQQQQKNERQQGRERRGGNDNGQQQQRRQQQQRKPKKPLPTVEDIPNLFKVDQEILVQVTKGPIGSKGARVTTNLSIPGRYLVLLPTSSHFGVSKRVEERSEHVRLSKMIRELKVPQGMGLICRTVGAGCKQEHFQRDLDLLLEYWNKAAVENKKHAPVCVYQEPDLAERALRDCLTGDVDEVVTDSEAVYNRANELISRYNLQGEVKVRLYQSPTPIFNKFGLQTQLEGLFNRKVSLPSGGYICIDETEALIAIDVNTGKNRAGKDQPETILATNLEAVQEIARQLRLRNVGGLVVLDLIDMRQKKDQMTVYKALKELMNEDHAKTKVYPISPLGLLEMTRQRENESIESAIFENCPYCKGRGLVKSATTMSVDIQRRVNEVLAKRKLTGVIVRVHPRVHERLKREDRKLFDDISAQNNATVTFEPDPMMHVEDFVLLDARSGQKV
ncbi:MAG: Rne/Rng family ribonuclease [Victivallales bacterium]|nr:Rne/Rng family ribonuclease [Victivallales bacterium]